MVSRSRFAFALGVAIIPAVVGVTFFANQRASSDGGGDDTIAQLPRQNETTLLELAARRLICADGERHVSEASFDGDAHWNVLAQCLIDSPGGTHLTRDRSWWVSDADLSIDSAATSEPKPPANCSDTYTFCIGEAGPRPSTFALTVTPGSAQTPIR